MTPEKTLSIPAFWAMAWATISWSPVTITTSNPICFSSEITFRASSFMVSVRATIALTFPPDAATTTVLPSLSHRLLYSATSVKSIP